MSVYKSRVVQESTTVCKMSVINETDCYLTQIRTESYTNVFV